MFSMLSVVHGFVHAIFRHFIQYSLYHNPYMFHFLVCPPGATILKDKYCFTGHFGQITWEKARQKCRQRGGDLLQTQTKEKFDSLYGERIEVEVLLLHK